MQHQHCRWITFGNLAGGFRRHHLNAVFASDDCQQAAAEPLGHFLSNEEPVDLFFLRDKIVWTAAFVPLQAVRFDELPDLRLQLAPSFFLGQLPVQLAAPFRRRRSRTEPISVLTAH